jgi:hypothetical protein
MFTTGAFEFHTTIWHKKKHSFSKGPNLKLINSQHQLIFCSASLNKTHLIVVSMVLYGFLQEDHKIILLDLESQKSYNFPNLPLFHEEFNMDCNIAIHFKKQAQPVIMLQLETECTIDGNCPITPYKRYILSYDLSNQDKGSWNILHIMNSMVGSFNGLLFKIDSVTFEF